MLNAKAFAHAATAVTAIFYSVCLLFSYLAPEFLFSIGSSWVHSLNLEVLKTANPITFTNALWGLMTISAATWVTMYYTISLYNKWAKK